MKIYTAALEGLHLTLTQVEADVSNGLPSFIIVGLGDTSIKEARERIRSAVKKSGFIFPLQKKIVSLSPAHVKKQGSGFDLPVAVSMLFASGQLKCGSNDPIFCAGELMLSGAVRKVPGILPMAHFAKQKGFKKIFVPYFNRKEAALIRDINIYPVKHLREIASHIEGRKLITAYRASNQKSNEKSQKNRMPSQQSEIDFEHIAGHEIPKRVLAIAAAGGHHVLLVGPPGTGKTMLAKAYPGILPFLNEEAVMEVSMIYSITQEKHNLPLPITMPPFRHVHHGISTVTLIGGGNPLNIGEITMAHKGVLFLDEFAEFSKSAREALREPLQEGVIRLGKYGSTKTLPAHFQLIAAMNPCSCGYYGDPKKSCKCTPYQIKQYYKKISGPILDRIDLVIEVPRLPRHKLGIASLNSSSVSSVDIQKSVMFAREVQNKRGFLNNQITMKDIKNRIHIEPDAMEFLQNVTQQFSLSPRSYLSIVKVSRTIADMEKSEKITQDHIAETLQYRKGFED